MYKVLKKFGTGEVGDIIELNDRRAKSELRNGNVVVYKELKGHRKTKQHKPKVETK